RCIVGKRLDLKVRETSVARRPGDSTIDGLLNAACVPAQQNGSSAVRVHSDGFDSIGAGTDVGPRRTTLLSEQRDRCEQDSDDRSFHTSSLVFFQYQAAFEVATFRVLFGDLEDEDPGTIPMNQRQVSAARALA